ncbi:hypothetical protein ACU635_60795 [[Actinomadura] parvosata]|uniref:hypothetical protein n=1 Tax=[Actinomadura] parvosata TaxID=1955412 RepID=UPI00406C1907
MHHSNASWGFGAGNVVSTTHDVSAFQRAFDQGKLLPPSLRKILTGGGSRQQDSGQCQDDLKMQGGSGLGYTTLILFSTDGRRQFEMSVTRSTGDSAIIPEMVRAGEAVLCP